MRSGVQTCLRPDTGSSGRFDGDGFWMRNANVGIGGSFGSVKLGIACTPLFVSSLLFNPFVDSFGFSPTMHTYFSPTGQVAGGTEWSNAVTREPGQRRHLRGGYSSPLLSAVLIGHAWLLASGLLLQG